MTEEQKAAYVIAQTAMFNAHIALMQAENADRANRGLAVAYKEEAFAETIKEYGNLHHNELIGFFHGH